MVRRSFPAFLLALSAVMAFPAPLGAGGSFKGRVIPPDSASCSGVAHWGREQSAWADAAKASLDRVRDKVEEWGLVTISAPVAVIDSDAFRLDESPIPLSQLFDEAARDINAGAFQSTETALGNTFSAEVAAQIPGTGAAPAATTTTTTTTAPPSLLDALPAATKPFGLFPEKFATTKSVSERLKEATDNSIRQKINAQLLKPRRIAGHNRILFALVEVSCNPGWRTSEHYIADCSATVEYYDRKKNELVPRCERRAPVVFSVLPLQDAQTVEMGNSQRNVTQLAFQLAASFPAKGFNVKVKDIFEFVRRYSRDLKSTTPIPVVNSYSSGRTFGFRFSPSFQALRDPAQRASRAGNVLLPTTFPALVTIVAHDDDLDFLNSQTSRPALLTHVSTRWFLKDHPPLWQLHRRLFSPMKRDTAAIEIDAARDVAEFYSHLQMAETQGARSAGGGYRFDPLVEELRRQVTILETKGIGNTWPIPVGQSLLDAMERDAVDKENGVAQTAAKNLKELDKTKAALKKAEADLKDLRDQELANLKDQVRRLQRQLRYPPLGFEHKSQEEPPSGPEPGLPPAPIPGISSSPPIPVPYGGLMRLPAAAEPFPTEEDESNDALPVADLASETPRRIVLMPTPRAGRR